jgi:hypothetical protein
MIRIYGFIRLFQVRPTSMMGPSPRWGNSSPVYDWSRAAGSCTLVEGDSSMGMEGDGWGTSRRWRRNPYFCHWFIRIQNYFLENLWQSDGSGSIFVKILGLTSKL